MRQRCVGVCICVCEFLVLSMHVRVVSTNVSVECVSIVSHTSDGT